MVVLMSCAALQLHCKMNVRLMGGWEWAVLMAFFFLLVELLLAMSVHSSSANVMASSINLNSALAIAFLTFWLATDGLVWHVISWFC